MTILTRHTRKLTKLIGGGQSWWYVIDSDGIVLGVAHEGDADGMARLRKLVGR